MTVFEVKGRKFEIDFVNNYIIEMYQDMAAASDKLINNVSNMKSNIIDEEVKNLAEEQRSLSHQITTLRKKILVELVSTNGYEYDERFWMRSIDHKKVNEFVISVIADSLSDVPKSKRASSKK